MVHWLLFCMRATTCASLSLALSSCAHLPSCSETPQLSPQQPDLVQRWDAVLPSTLSPEESKRYTSRVEELGTKTYYHDIVLHPRATLDASTGVNHPNLSVAAPIFLVALEKPTKNAPSHVRNDCKGRDFTVEKVRAPDDPLLEPTVKTLCNVLTDPRPQLLTQIVALDGVREGHYGDATFLYNVYDISTDPSSKGGETDALYGIALQGLATLRTAVREALTRGEITDVVVLSTGWNTRQRETLYNTLDWMAFIGEARMAEKRAYRPLYLTISWQSAWESKALNAVKANVMTKGNDADEIGLTWVNRLVHDIVVPEAAARDVPVTLVGHSYGARVVGTALYMRNVIERPAWTISPPIAFVGLQPAFPINRYGRKVGKEPWFATVDPHALVVLTSSSYDDATSSLPWGRYAGGGGSLSRVKEDKDGNLDEFGCEVLNADQTGQIEEPSRLVTSRPHLVNANAFVACNMPQTGGGAHSDVYDAASGRFVAQVMDVAFQNASSPPPDSGGLCQTQ